MTPFHPRTPLAKYLLAPLKLAESLRFGTMWLDHLKVIRSEYSRQVRAGAAAAGRDSVISVNSVYTSLLSPAMPQAIWADAPYTALIDLYGIACPKFIRTAVRQQEVDALARTWAAIYSSDWAAAEAATLFPRCSPRLHVVHYGANIEASIEEGWASMAIALRQPRECRLVWIGMDWERKRGDFAVKVAQGLIARGVNTRLIVIGKSPFSAGSCPPFVDLLGFISKGTRDGVARFVDALANAHFMILPTKADCSPIVICEAFALAVPPVTNDVGGIGSYVQHRKNGLMLPIGATPDEFASEIIGAFSEPDYRSMAMEAFQTYKTKTNWRVGWRKVLGILDSVRR